MTGDALSGLTDHAYEFGFHTSIEAQTLPKGLSESTVRAISAIKNEPQFVLDFRLKAYCKWLTMSEPHWASTAEYAKIDYQDIIYYSAPKTKTVAGLEQVDPKLRETFDKLGVPIFEQKRLAGVAVDAIFDSVSVATSYQAKLLEQGIIFCSFSEAVHKYPELVRRYMGTVVPYDDNFYAALNSAVFTDGSFVYIPKKTRCPMELSSYFRINTEKSGQFERTLIVCEDDSAVSYLEGCTAPRFDTNQLHAAVVELVALDRAEIKYSTVQNWYAGDPVTGKGGIFNFVTKRGLCRGARSKISWTQVETGSAITWKYPGCVLEGEASVGEFYSVALVNHHQQADTGTRMIHIGADTKSTIISKGISAGQSAGSYRGLVDIRPSAACARNFTKCDSLLIGSSCWANTTPKIRVQNSSAQTEHEATTSKVSDDQLFYFLQRGIGTEEAMSAILNGFCKDVFRELPMEFAVEASKLLDLKLENTVG